MPTEHVTPEMADDLHWVVVRAYSHRLQVQSNTAREFAAEVAAAASLGLITTDLFGTFGRTWRVTDSGIRFVKERLKQ